MGNFFFNIVGPTQKVDFTLFPGFQANYWIFFKTHNCMLTHNSQPMQSKLLGLCKLKSSKWIFPKFTLQSKLSGPSKVK